MGKDANGVVWNPASGQWIGRILSSFPQRYTVYEDAVDGKFRGESNRRSGTDYESDDFATLFQNVLTEIATTGGGVKIRINSDAWTPETLSASLTVPSNTKPIIIQGEGYGKTVLDGSALADYALSVGNDAVWTNYVILRDLRLDGGLKVRNSQYFHLEDCYFGNSGTGRYCVDAEGTIYEFSMSGSYVYSGKSGGMRFYGRATGLGDGQVNDVRIVHSAIAGCTNSLIEIDGSSALTHSGIISSCDLETEVGTIGHGILMNEANRWIINGNRIAGEMDASHDLINISGADDSNRSIYIGITNNEIFATSAANRSGIYVDWADQTTIANNPQIYGNTNSVVATSNSYRLHLYGNVLTSLPSLAGNYKVRDNEGYVTRALGNSTGTGAMETIAHGCSFTPAINEVSFSERTTGGALTRHWQAPDATNIYPIATAAKDYIWLVEKVSS